ncbi:MAG: hypothetical protein ACQERN_12760 [Thermodesulfobacteriota bacterium]
MAAEEKLTFDVFSPSGFFEPELRLNYDTLRYHVNVFARRGISENCCENQCFSNFDLQSEARFVNLILYGEPALKTKQATTRFQQKSISSRTHNRIPGSLFTEKHGKRIYYFQGGKI